MNAPGSASDPAQKQFQTTHWSLVVRAADPDQPHVKEALAALCEKYWYPLYAYARRRVPDLHEAQDLTQAFFACLLEKDLLATASQERGRFRTFLLTALQHFIVNEWHKARAEKRGGDRTLLSLDFEAGDSRFRLEPSIALTAERLFERQWAMTLLDRGLARLRETYHAAGEADRFERLQPFIGGHRPEESFADVAAELGLTAGAAKVAAHRLRKQYREILRDELAQTVESESEIDNEIAWLFRVLA